MPGLDQKRRVILAGMAGGALWAVLVLWLGAALQVQMAPWRAGAWAAFLCGLPLMAMIGRLAGRRFFDDEIIDGAPLRGTAEIDGRVLQNTVEQIVLAACIWPFASLTLGPGILLTLGASFVVMRGVFWWGYHRAPPLRGFGFAATFYPTVAAALCAFAGLF